MRRKVPFNLAGPRQAKLFALTTEYMDPYLINLSYTREIVVSFGKRTTSSALVMKNGFRD
jgi:hypothetical protein